jgi:hypothetical protein
LLAAGAVALLAVSLWRLAWLHRFDLGLLRLVGFRRRALVVFVAVQAVVLVVCSAGAGVLIAVVAAPRIARTSIVVSVGPVIDQAVVLRAAGYTAMILVVALSVPLAALLRRGVGELVHRDD